MNVNVVFIYVYVYITYVSYMLMLRMCLLFRVLPRGHLQRGRARTAVMVVENWYGVVVIVVYEKATHAYIHESIHAL